MNNSAFQKELKRRLSGELPGESVQLRMAPDFRMPLSFYEKEIMTAKIAAVMVLLFRDKNDELSTLLIKRRETGIHASQIALPGGRAEEQDASLEFTAIRETHEEVNVHPSSLEILGSLSKLYIPPSRFLVTPYIAWYNGPLEFIKAEDEISALYITPLSLFTEDSNKFTSEFITHTGIPTRAPAYKLGDESIWGATAMIFSEFAEVYKDLL